MEKKVFCPRHLRKHPADPYSEPKEGNRTNTRDCQPEEVDKIMGINLFCQITNHGNF
jgi:hypothetical protein